MEDNDNEGLSTGKKVVAGAAIGVAVPAAVGVAKKLMGDGDGDDRETDGGKTGRAQRGNQSRARSTGSARTRSSTTKQRAGSTAKSGSRRTTRTRSAGRSTRARASSSSSASASGRTKEQLYNQAKRLGIEGRSSMTKAQLERAINRARS
jgi:hypothetical protein